MSVTALKNAADYALPPICADCRWSPIELVQSLTGPMRVCTCPRFTKTNNPVRLNAWKCRTEYGCGFDGVLFEPRPAASTG